MKGGTQAALVLGVGYVLGRRRKLRTATLLAAAAATGGLGSLGGAALRRGIKTLGSTEALSGLSPQLADIAETVRSDLVDAGKAAAIAAVNNRIGSLSDTLHERAESLRNPVGDAAEGAGDAAEGAGAAAERGRDAAGEARRGAGEAGRAAQETGRRAASRPRIPGRGVVPRPRPEHDDEEEETAESDDAEERRPRPARRAPHGRPVVSRPRR
jgi:hypothetical protein